MVASLPFACPGRDYRACNLLCSGLCIVTAELSFHHCRARSLVWHLRCRAACSPVWLHNPCSRAHARALLPKTVGPPLAPYPALGPGFPSRARCPLGGGGGGRGRYLQGTKATPVCIGHCFSHVPAGPSQQVAQHPQPCCAPSYPPIPVTSLGVLHRARGLIPL